MKKQLYKKLFFPLFLFFMVSFVPGNVFIGGRVLTREKKPIVGALVRLHFSGAKKVLKKKTDRDGRFSFFVKNYKKYILFVSKNGFLEQSFILSEKNIKKNKYYMDIVLMRNESSEVNWDIKSLLRASNVENNLIFKFGRGAKIKSPKRNGKGNVEDKPALIYGSGRKRGREKIFLSTTSEIFGGGDFFSFPINLNSGFTTKFAYLQPVGSRTNIIVAGRINSSEQEDVSLKNVVQLDISKKHKTEITFGFSRFGQIESTVSNSFSNSIENEIINTFQPIKTLNVSFKDIFKIDEPLQVVYGFDLTHVNGKDGITFVNPKFEFHFTPQKNLDVFFNANQERKSYDSEIAVDEGERFSLLSPVSVSRVNGLDTYVNRYTHYDSGFSFLIGNNTKLKLTTFIDKVAGAGVPFVAVLKNPFKDESKFYPVLPSKYTTTNGVKFDFEHRWNEILKTSVIYIYGTASFIEGYSQSEGKFSFAKRFVNKISTNVDFTIPSTKTNIKTIYNYSPGENPIFGVGSFYDYYATGNNSLNLFIKQKISFLNSNFGKWEAILDLRDILNQGIDVYETMGGDLIIVRNRRSLRGGINFHF